MDWGILLRVTSSGDRNLTTAQYQPSSPRFVVGEEKRGSPELVAYWGWWVVGVVNPGIGTRVNYVHHNLS